MVSLVSSSWLVVGDFIAVLGAHEALGSRSPARSSCEDFRLMIDDCDLVGIRSQGARFTWVRGRSNRTRVERRLVRVLVSDGCISCWREISCVALPRSPSQVVIYKLRNLKKALKSWNWEVFGDLNFTIVRKSAELHSIQLDLSNWGFSDDLFMAEASVHSELDVLLRRQECFYRDRSRVWWLRDGDHNTSFFHVSIKRRRYGNTISALSINGVLSEDQSTIRDHIINYYSGLFSSDVSRVGRDLSIMDDVIPSLKKCYRGNLAMKIDIRKVFYTLDWSFLCRVLQAFGFSFIFVDWINDILHSSRLSVLFNGVPKGYFRCSRGVRQGDPLSPLLFGIAEDFLSRLLKRLMGSS
ncbi:hypothetical protein LWI28_018618 [Acer negundo]|uniref:Reverse transcriptase domain-containing protein n=1 Tax=Acer negundo TaxID=4023 RepID=A0AAD5IVF0_ACENE|nr:hypothetical protein LWI28_018618 [Acer negundo]